MKKLILLLVVMSFTAYSQAQIEANFTEDSSSETVKEANVIIGPNLFSSDVSITFKDGEAVHLISIVSLNGKNVYEQTTHEEKLSISLADEQTGVYVLNIKGGSKTETYKLMKQ